jgi:hypothetical protein
MTAREANAIIDAVLKEWGVRPGTLYVEEHDGRLYLGDPNHAPRWGDPLTDAESTPDGIRQIAYQWLDAVLDA